MEQEQKQNNCQPPNIIWLQTHKHSYQSENKHRIKLILLNPGENLIKTVPKITIRYYFS